MLFNDFDYLLGRPPGTIHSSPDRKKSCTHAVMVQVDKAFDNGDDNAEVVGYVPVKYRKTVGSNAAMWPDTSQTKRNEARTELLGVTKGMRILNPRLGGRRAPSAGKPPNPRRPNSTTNCVNRSPCAA